MEDTLTRMIDGLWPCPRCEVKCETLPKLRAHVSRHHHGTPIRTKISSQKGSQKKSLYNKKSYLKRKSEKRKLVRERQPLTYSIAIKRGSFGCKNPLVVLKESSIPNAGLGVFATQDLFPGDYVTWYTGKEIYGEKPDDCRYLLAIDGENLFYLDGIRTPIARKGLGSFINRELRTTTATRKNCEYEYTPDTKFKVWIVITKKLRRGQELFTTYGRGMRISTS